MWCPTRSRWRKSVAAALAQSLQTFEEIQSLPELGQTLLAYGRFKVGDDAAEGQRLIARARGIFIDIGAAGWVAEAHGRACSRSGSRRRCGRPRPQDEAAY
jgi:hypothetical protein